MNKFWNLLYNAIPINKGKNGERNEERNHFASLSFIKKLAKDSLIMKIMTDAKKMLMTSRVSGTKLRYYSTNVISGLSRNYIKLILVSSTRACGKLRFSRNPFLVNN